MNAVLYGCTTHIEVGLLKITDTHSDLAQTLRPACIRLSSDVSLAEYRWRNYTGGTRDSSSSIISYSEVIVIYYTNDRLQGFHYMTLRKLGAKCWTALGWLALTTIFASS